MATVTISLPEALRAYIEAQVANGGFGTVSEYIRSLIREDQKRQTESRLESLLLEGLQSNVNEMSADDWDMIRQEIRKRKQTRGTK